MTTLPLVALVAVALAFPATAHADVQVRPPAPVADCGDPVVVAVRTDATTKGRTVRITVTDRPTGRRWFDRSVLAYRGRWRTWYLPSGKTGRCHTSVVRYRGTFADGRHWQARFVIRFRRELG